MRPRKPLSRRNPKERTAKDKQELKERLEQAKLKQIKFPKMLSLTQALLKGLGRRNLVKIVDKGYTLQEIKKMIEKGQLTKENVDKIPEKKER